MNLSSPLGQFFDRHARAWRQTHGHLPVTDRPESGPAGAGDHPRGQLWQPAARAPFDFANLARALELTLHPSLAAFYGHYYAGNPGFDAPFGAGELLQPWNEEDFEFLQENLIGHAMMKQKLKQPPTWFIGVMADSDLMLVLDNGDGSIWLELPGMEPETRVADSLEALLQSLSPRVVLPEPMAEASPRPGFWQRVKTMLGHLTGRS
ncbi:SecY-interacting protein [Ferrimonas sediminicola]|uniref:SecY-interacting protein n=1 Tax=Ferrimonas sediminicola TaxID=2569538 RepID=A0A4U1BER6_9GAMM|nr:SecY-interacting protein [Ferrimonas sediminicola]TKB49724.1 SecY-interacting protein [Ferrimonas sediminicola]